ncbi:MAG: M48 family metallopeptidase [Planctomycetota bacterium]|nr:M48 family metallopeptidase [Planctomycetota bacterium]
MSTAGPTSFFEQQDLARRNSKRLIWLFGLAVLAMMICLNLVVVFLFVSAAKNPQDQSQLTINTLETIDTSQLAMLIGGTTIGTGTIIGLASLGKTVALASGGSVVAESLSGRLIEPQDVKDPLEKRLLNIVEEMAIASGVPVPPVYVMDNEEGINAFAAGHKPTDAVIGVTRGTLQTLSRDQLQGVIAHEFSHILNGDMRLNIRMIGVLYGLLFLSIIGRTIIRLLGNTTTRRSSSDDKDNKGNPMAVVYVIAIALFVLGYLGYFLGRLIQAALSRQREFLADASAVQFTRNPDGIAGALKTIGGWTNHAQIQSPEALETAHLFFGDSIKRISINSPMATHPPLQDRILRLDPNWDGTYPEPTHIVEAAQESIRNPSKPSRNPMNLPGMPNIPGGISIPPILAGLAEGAGGRQNLGQDVDRSLTTAGQPGDEQFGYARSFKELVPEYVEEITREPLSASCIVLWLLAPSPDDVALMPEPFRGEYPRVARLMSEELQQYPVDLCKLIAPAIRRLSSSQMVYLITEADRLILADDKVKMGEWLVKRMVTNQLRRSKDPMAKSIGAKSEAMPDTNSAVALLISALAWSGQSGNNSAESQSSANQAVSKAGPMLANVISQSPTQCMPKTMINAQRLDAALVRLSSESAKVRLAIIRAAAEVVQADAVVTRREFDMVRVVADSLDCPLPPMMIA